METYSQAHLVIVLDILNKTDYCIDYRTWAKVCIPLNKLTRLKMNSSE